MDTRKLTTLSAFGSGLLCLGLAIAPRFDAQVQYRLGSSIGSAPSWLVPAGAEFKSLEPGYGSLKFPAALLGAGLMTLSMSLARKHGAEEGMRQRIKQQRRKAEEARSAIHHAYELQFEQVKCDAVFQARRLEFEAQVEEAFVESMGISPTLPALPGTTLDQTTNPGDKVRDAEAKPAIPQSGSTEGRIADARGDAIADSTPDTSTTWEQQFTSQTALIWGNQGGGKSWIARHFAKLKKQQGYRVIVLDPDSNRSEWLGVESHHTFEDIEKTIRWYVGELERRYRDFNDSSVSEETWRSRLWAEGKAIALITEEMTTYTDFIRDKELLSKFVRLGLTKSRKQEMPITFVAHNNTQSCLGDITGLKNLIDRMLQLQCVATVDPVTLQPRSSGKGKVKLDGSSEWLDVALPRIERKITDFRSDTPAPQQRRIDPNVHDPEYFERTYQLEFDLNRPDTQAEPSEPPEPPAEPLNRPNSEAYSDSERRFTPLNLTREQAIALIKSLRPELNQTQVIERLWQVTKGGSGDWKRAREEFRELMGE